MDRPAYRLQMLRHYGVLVVHSTIKPEFVAAAYHPQHQPVNEWYAYAYATDVGCDRLERSY